MQCVLDDIRKDCSRELVSGDISSNNVAGNDMQHGKPFLCLELLTRSSLVFRSFYALYVMWLLVEEARYI
jgi:hypothetical protein